MRKVLSFSAFLMIGLFAVPISRLCWRAEDYDAVKTVSECIALYLPEFYYD